MTLPTFLGIGVMRGGTTWLYELLANHPDVYVPTRRKEVHFFNSYYERGLQWYEEFFPAEAEAEQYRAIGEITPAYFHCPRCPERIASMPSVTKLILIMRNPIDRAYSHYGKWWVQTMNDSRPFEDLLSLHPKVIQIGFYSQYLRNYFCYFKGDQVLALIFEHAVADVSKTKGTLARFLGVAADRFPPTAGAKRVNRSYIPKARFVYSLSVKVARNLQERNLDWVVNLVRRLGIERLFGEGDPLPPMKEETRKYLREIYRNEIRELESLLQIDLACWE